MKRRWKILLSVLLCAALLTGCGSSRAPMEAPVEGLENGGMQDAPGEYEEGWSEDAMVEAVPEAGAADAPMVEAPLRKIIHNASLSMETKEYDDTRSRLMAAVKEHGGYLESSSETGSAEMGNRWAEYVLRIPSEHYSEFLQAAEGAGSLVRKDESTEDITREYVDVEARLESLRVQEKRLLELAAQAQTMEDLLTIEGHLADVQYQIESYTSQQRVFDDRVDYSTITVDLREVTVYTPTVQSFGSRIQEALGDSWDNFVIGAQEFVIGFIYFFPTLVVLVILFVLVRWVWRKVRKGKSNRLSRRQTKKAEKPAPKAPEE